MYAHAENWKQLIPGPAMPPKSILSIDMDSIVRNGDIVTVWSRYQNWSQDTTFQSNSSYDCRQRLSWDNASFQIGYESKKRYNMEPDRQPKPINPGWGGEVIFNTLCSKKFYEFWKP